MTIKTNSLAVAALACISIQSVSKASWMDPGFNSFSNSFTLTARYSIPYLRQDHGGSTVDYRGGSQTVTGTSRGTTTLIEAGPAQSRFTSIDSTDDTLESFSSSTSSSADSYAWMASSSADSSSKVVLNLNSRLNRTIYINAGGSASWPYAATAESQFNATVGIESNGSVTNIFTANSKTSQDLSNYSNYYRIDILANTNYVVVVEQYSSAFGSYGSNPTGVSTGAGFSITFSAITPSPAASALFALAGFVSRRRRA